MTGGEHNCELPLTSKEPADQDPSPPQTSDSAPTHSYLEPVELLESAPVGEATPYIPPPEPRTPNIAEAVVFLLFWLLGWIIAGSALGIAVHYHWLGWKSLEDIESNTTLMLATTLVPYLFALGLAVPLLRRMWHGYFSGLHWHGFTAWRLRYWLIVIAVLCNALAAIGNWLLPFPEHAPVDKMFTTATDAWLMLGFGVLIAPFFEEMIFRGFLLPAFATAWDWCFERIEHKPPRALDATGNPVWSTGAMVFSAMLVSAPFAWMHSEQVAKAWGPLLLLYCVSLILCAVRLATRSLAASTLVHSAYNAMLFSVMLFQTDGFRHLDKL